MDIKLEITTRFKSMTRFAKILGAPLATIHSWTRTKHRHHPSEWQILAFLDAVAYRSKKVAGWRCRRCGCVVVESQAGIKPPFCAVCGSIYFNPVSVIDETEKSQDKEIEQNED